jgi:hypothetical protein
MNRAAEAGAGGVAEWRLWALFLLPPAAWAFALMVGYAVVDAACASDATLSLGLVLGAPAVLGAGAAVVAWRTDRALRAHGDDDSPMDGASASGRDRPARTAARRQLMGVTSAILSALLAVILVAHLVAMVVLGPCDR